MSKPRIDSFGNFQIGPGPAGRGRLIGLGGTSFALFPEGDEEPSTLTLDGTPVVKGRTLTSSIDGEAFVFQRASCGCQTPQHLRGPARKFLALLEPADA